MSRTQQLDKSFEAFARMYPGLADPSGANDQCRIAADALVNLLVDGGFAARIAWLQGHRGTVPRQGSIAPISREVEHIVVIVEDRMAVDFTRRQFDPQADFPTRYESIDELGRHWRQIALDSGGLEWRELPSVIATATRTSPSST